MHSSRRPCPFFLPEYIDAHLAHHLQHTGSPYEVFVLVVRDDGGTAVGALPMRSGRSPYVRGVQLIEFLATSEIDAPTPVAAPEHEYDVGRALIQELIGSLGVTSALHLTNQTPDGAFAAALDAEVRRSHRCTEYPGMPVNSVVIRHETMAEFHAGLSKRMRSNVGRLSRRLLTSGRPELLTSNDPCVLPELLDVYLDIEDRSWKRATEASLRGQPQRVELLREMLGTPTEIEYLIDVLTLDGTAIGGLVSMVFGRTLYLMEITFDARHSEVSPSNLLIALSVERAISRGCDEVAMHGHFAYYKHRWLAETTTTCDYRVQRSGSLADVRAALGGLRRRLGDDPSDWTPSGARENDAPVPESTTRAVIDRLRSTSGVRLFNHEDIDQRLPFDTGN